MDEMDKPGRNKYWSEVGIEEKVERMRQIIKQLAKDRTLSELWGIVGQLQTHVHAQHDGRILYDSIQSRYGMVAGDERPSHKKDDEVYF